MTTWAMPPAVPLIKLMASADGMCVLQNSINARFRLSAQAAAVRRSNQPELYCRQSANQNRAVAMETASYNWMKSSVHICIV